MKRHGKIGVAWWRTIEEKAEGKRSGVFVQEHSENEHRTCSVENRVIEHAVIHAIELVHSWNILVELPAGHRLPQSPMPAQQEISVSRSNHHKMTHLVL